MDSSSIGVASPSGEVDDDIFLFLEAGSNLEDEEGLLWEMSSIIFKSFSC